jgi:CHAT domain-containing protein
VPPRVSRYRGGNDHDQELWNPCDHAHGDATYEAVINGLQKHRIVHFAYKGMPGIESLYETAVILQGDERVTLHDVVGSRIPTTDLAVLAASHTAELTGKEKNVEGLHLAAAMHYCGFKSVVGTMWDMSSADEPQFSELFYAKLCSMGEKDGIPLGEKSAEALRHTVQILRKRGVPMHRWVKWVHYGL